MNSIWKVMALGLAMTVAGVFAQEAAAPAANDQEAVLNDWNISVGLSYRHLKKAKFNSKKTAPYIGAFMDGQPIQRLDDFLGSCTTAATLINVVSVPATGGYSKGGYSNAEETGFVLGASYTLKEEDSLRLSLVCNFQYSQADSSASVDGTDVVSGYQYAMVQKNINWAATTDGPFDVNVPGGGARSKFAMDLYTIDCGAKLGYDFENGLSLNLAGGPSLSLADMESSSTAAATVAAPSSTTHKNENETEWGYYFSFGAEYWMSEKNGISFDLRYDKAFGEVGTRYASQNLDTWGGSLRYLYRF